MYVYQAVGSLVLSARPVLGGRMVSSLKTESLFSAQLLGRSVDDPESDQVVSVGGSGDAVAESGRSVAGEHGGWLGLYLRLSLYL